MRHPERLSVSKVLLTYGLLLSSSLFQCILVVSEICLYRRILKKYLKKGNKGTKFVENQCEGTKTTDKCVQYSRTLL